MKVTNIALKYKTSVFVLLFIFIGSGLVSYLSLPVESFPAIKQPIVVVAAPYVGVAPSDMETLVVQPIEDKLQELQKIKKLSSQSIEGYASIVAEFEPDIDIDEAVRKVREKVDLSRPDLPNDFEDPIIQEINFENIPIVTISIVGNQSLVRLKEIAEDLQDELEEIPGVLEVNLNGGLEREVKVDVNPSRLRYYNIGLNDITEAIQNENLTIPGGSMKSNTLKWTVRVPGEFHSIEELSNIVVNSDNGPVYLRDVAEVSMGFKEQETLSRLNSKPSVSLSVVKRSGENILRISDEVKRILEEAQPEFPSGVEYHLLGDLSKDIRIMVNELENNILFGLILVVLVLYFFMGGRNGFLVGIAIPMSMLVSFVLLNFLGFTLNMMVLFSLILALGMLVDNAVVIIENMYRLHEEGLPLMEAARKGTAEVGVAVIVSTLTTLLAFLPLIFWEGLIGEFMRYMPMTVIITLASSLFVGLIFNPVIASSYMEINPNLDKLAGERMLRKWTGRYENLLKSALAHRLRTVMFTILAFLLMLSTYVVFNHGMEFFPSQEPRQIFVDIEMPLGTRLEATDAVAEVLEKRIADTPDMRSFVVSIGAVTDPGNPFAGSGGATSHRGQIQIEMIDRFERSQNSYITLDEIARAVRGIPGAKVEVIKLEDGPPTGKAVEIQVKGNDFKKLSAISRDIQKKIADVPGIAKLKDDHESGKPELTIRIDREKAAIAGLSTRDIANTIRTAVNGLEASEYRFGTEEYEITVRFTESFRQGYSDLLNLTVFHEGTHYPLANFATVELASGLSNVNHVDGDRVVTVSADAVGETSPAEVLAEVKSRLEGFSPPTGYTIAFSGQEIEQQETAAFLMKSLMLAIFLIFFLLVTEFNSVKLPFVIMATVFLSLFGVFLGLLVFGKKFGIIMTGLGVISLAGIVVNNAIVLIDYIQKLRERGMSKMDAIIQGGKTRLRPVLLTAITTILGLIPLTFGINIDLIGLIGAFFRLFTGDPELFYAFSSKANQYFQFGAESSQWWSGMGVVVIAGLAFATILTLVVVPVLYYWLGKPEGAYQTTGETVETPSGGESDSGLTPPQEAPQGA